MTMNVFQRKMFMNSQEGSWSFFFYGKWSLRLGEGSLIIVFKISDREDLENLNEDMKIFLWRFHWDISLETLRFSWRYFVGSWRSTTIFLFEKNQKTMKIQFQNFILSHAMHHDGFFLVYSGYISFFINY